MGYKKTDPCLEKAFDDERLFVLMTRDRTAPWVVLEWIKANFGIQPEAKLREAFECALEMQKRCDYFNQKKKLDQSLSTEGESELKEGKPKTQPSPDLELCDQCDGCGWYEGGPTLKTTCKTCEGTGYAKKIVKPDPIRVEANSYPELKEKIAEAIKLPKGIVCIAGKDFGKEEEIEFSKEELENDGLCTYECPKECNSPGGGCTYGCYFKGVYAKAKNLEVHSDHLTIRPKRNSKGKDEENE